MTMFTDGFTILREVIYRLDGITDFFSSIADIFILLCLVELALSFLRALGNHNVYYRIIRYSDFFLIAVLVVLASVTLGEEEEWVTKSHYGFIRVSLATVDNLDGAYNIIYWITSLAIIFLSAFVLYSSMQKKHLRSVSETPLSYSLLLSILPVSHLSTFTPLLQIYLSKASYSHSLRPPSSPAASSLHPSSISPAGHGNSTTQSVTLSTLNPRLLSHNISMLWAQFSSPGSQYLYSDSSWPLASRRGMGYGLSNNSHSSEGL
jgi:hypothetical protein